MPNFGPITALLATLLLVSACVSPQEAAVDRENLLSAAGFRVLPANTTERVASLRSLPANRVVQQIQGGSVRYVYADPLVCGCLYVGDQNAYGRFRQAIFQRRLADEQSFTAQMNQENWNQGPWGAFY